MEFERKNRIATRVTAEYCLSPGTNSDYELLEGGIMKSAVGLWMILAATLAFAQSAAVTAKAWDASSIAWQNIYPDGTKWAVLEGDKDATGKAFTYAFSIPAGYWEHHSHNQDARVAVISGALRVAIGPTLDKTGAKTYPIGSFLLVPANVQHTMGADVDTIIIGTAIGPWKTHHDEEHMHTH
jgi:quercetin dioxygenase-like cupin family protein